MKPYVYKPVSQEEIEILKDTLGIFIENADGSYTILDNTERSCTYHKVAPNRKQE